MKEEGCIFCKIGAGELKAAVVYEDDLVIVFLDNAPLFPGHCLVCPKKHVNDMLDMPSSLVSPLFETARKVAQAVESGLEAGGSLICINNKVSQSVPHLHVHVIPRRPKDGLKGFFWPRRPYRDSNEMESVAESLRKALDK